VDPDLGSMHVPTSFATRTSEVKRCYRYQIFNKNTFVYHIMTTTKASSRIDGIQERIRSHITLERQGVLIRIRNLFDPESESWIRYKSPGSATLLTSDSNSSGSRRLQTIRTKTCGQYTFIKYQAIIYRKKG
jgi:hypothetical protein